MTIINHDMKVCLVRGQLSDNHCSDTDFLRQELMCLMMHLQWLHTSYTGGTSINVSADPFHQLPVVGVCNCGRFDSICHLCSPLSTQLYMINTEMVSLFLSIDIGLQALIFNMNV